MSKQHVHGRGPLEMDKLFQRYTLSGFLVILIYCSSLSVSNLSFQNVLLACHSVKWALKCCVFFQIHKFASGNEICNNFRLLSAVLISD